MPSLEQRALDRIAGEYSPAERSTVEDLLASYSGPERDRVIWDILALSGGDSQKLLHCLHTAQLDYRDILYWAEYYDKDPLVQDTDPQQMIKDLLARWS